MPSYLYQCYLDFRKELEIIEVEVPEEYKNGVKNRVYPNKCFDKSFDYMRENGDLPNLKYVEGLYTESELNHSWIEIDDRIVFDGTMQRFYDKEKYYQMKQAVKLVELDNRGMWEYLFQYQIGNGKPEFEQAKEEYFQNKIDLQEE